MPVKVWVNGKEMLLKATDQFVAATVDAGATVVVDKNYYVYTFNADGK
jgi:hypothetical protein